MALFLICSLLLSLAAALPGNFILQRESSPLSSCPGYQAVNVTVNQSSSALHADLELAGDACNTFSNDLTNLKLLVEYQTGK